MVSTLKIKDFPRLAALTRAVFDEGDETSCLGRAHFPTLLRQCHSVHLYVKHPGEG